MGYDTQTDICFHGFRAMARSALGECGLFQRNAIDVNGILKLTPFTLKMAK